MVLDKSASNVNQNLMKQSKSETYERLIVICIILGHIAIGYSMGSTSPIMDVLTQTFSLNSAQRSLIGSSTLIGNVFGSLIGGFLADQFGRKKTLLVAWYLLIIALLLGMLMLKQVGTKKTLLVSLFSTATPLLLLSLLLRLFNSTTLFLQIASIALLVMYNVSCNLPAPLCLIYPAKLFPSSIKGTASGICGMVARISTILCMFALGHAIEKVETNAVFLSIAVISNR
uniref:Uncharacterized protein LOC113788702 n=1 Tax=Dermatophagoides pteronyssinus TaxID=6956 RepID=A0A6P6XMG5_DERPT|nr:uncharacterized protein LOC113788702 [Dermatophagoides pteronyssinus]